MKPSGELELIRNDVATSMMSKETIEAYENVVDTVLFVRSIPTVLWRNVLKRVLSIPTPTYPFVSHITFQCWS